MHFRHADRSEMTKNEGRSLTNSEVVKFVLCSEMKGRRTKTDGRGGGSTGFEWNFNIILFLQFIGSIFIVRIIERREQSNENLFLFLIADVLFNMLEEEVGQWIVDEHRVDLTAIRGSNDLTT